jgi:hypothetical protein
MTLDPSGLASLGPSYVIVPPPDRSDRSDGPVNQSSYFLGDPPPDPRFLASLGALSLVELDHYSVVDLLPVGHC